MKFKTFLEAIKKQDLEKVAHYMHLELPELFKLRKKVEDDIEQERRAINYNDPHADLRSSVAYSTIRTFYIELHKIEAVIKIKTGEEKEAKVFLKRV